MAEGTGFDPETYGRHALRETVTAPPPIRRPETHGRSRMGSRGGMGGVTFIPTLLATTMILAGGNTVDGQVTAPQEQPQMQPEITYPFAGDVTTTPSDPNSDINSLIKGSDLAKLHNQ